MTHGKSDPIRAFPQGTVTREVIGAYYDVYNALGYGFLESVYQNALSIALVRRGLAVAREVPIDVYYEGQVVGHYRADLVVQDSVILETKAEPRLNPSHEAQLLHYLRATRLEVGLLLNFGRSAEFKRIVFSNPWKDHSSDLRSSAPI